MNGTQESPNTALANRQQPTQCSVAVPTSRSNLSAAAGEAELLACLTLVAPSGMTAEDRKAWVSVARATLSGIPADLLQRGCRKARETCRFASEIVPVIVETTRAEWDWRKHAAAEQARDQLARIPPPVREPIPREETQRILREIAAEKRA